MHKEVMLAFTQLQIPHTAHIIVGVSGGADSMTLAYLLAKWNFKISVAHVNFQLRGAESDADEQLVQTWCQQAGIPFYVLRSDADAYANAHGLNIQLAARKIRYDWWHSLKETLKADYIATAHHQDDHFETIVHHLLRGTGLKGLTGIPLRQNDIIRPFLGISANDIRRCADDLQIPFREDSSNQKDDYTRNKIRHHVIPVLREVMPDFASRSAHTAKRLQYEWSAFAHSMLAWQKQSIIETHAGYKIQLQQGQEAFLLRWLEEKGFPWNLACDFITSESNRSDTYLHQNKLTLSRTADGFFLSKGETPVMHSRIESLGSFELEHGRLILEKADVTAMQETSTTYIVYLSEKSVQFPLTFRTISAGDLFQPFGMGGKSKKVQDLMVDRKLEKHEKEQVFILSNESHVLWVAPLQLDERARVGSEAKHVIRVRWYPL